MSSNSDRPQQTPVPDTANIGQGRIEDGEVRELIEGALAIARTKLGMDIAWLAEFTGDLKVFRVLEGDAEGWGLADGDALEGAESYCRRVLDGRLPSVITDTATEPAVSDLEITRRLRIGSYVGVPLVLGDGTVYGAFCCASRTPDASLGPRDNEFMQVLARLIARQLDLRETERERRRLESRTAATRALLAAIEARDAYTGSHAQAVVEMAGRVGRRLGLEDDELIGLEQVALLHDIGKLRVPDSVLRKPGPLTDEEWELIRRHPEDGAELIRSLDALAHLAPAIGAEHEHWDGNGYPSGLAGSEIPVASRVTLVCDSFHAMTSQRPYRAALSVAEALAELERNSGTQFWPEAVEALEAEIRDSVGLSTSR